MAIEKKIKGIRKEFKGFKLYLDDLEEIARLFLELKKPGEKMVIETENEMIDNISELKGLSKKSLQTVQIYFASIEHGWKNYGREIYISKYRTELHLDEEGALPTSCAVSIHSVFTRNIIYIRKITKKLVWIFYPIAMLAFGVSLNMSTDNPYRTGVFISVLISLSLWIICIILNSTIKENVIIPIYKKDESTFLSRNKESILINLGFLVGGIFLGKLIDRIF